MDRGKKGRNKPVANLRQKQAGAGRWCNTKETLTLPRLPPEKKNLSNSMIQMPKICQNISKICPQKKLPKKLVHDMDLSPKDSQATPAKAERPVTQGSQISLGAGLAQDLGHSPHSRPHSCSRLEKASKLALFLPHFWRCI